MSGLNQTRQTSKQGHFTGGHFSWMLRSQEAGFEDRATGRGRAQVPTGVPESLLVPVFHTSHSGRVSLTSLGRNHFRARLTAQPPPHGAVTESETQRVEEYGEAGALCRGSERWLPPR